MERDGHQNANARLQSTNGEGAPQGYGYTLVTMHTFILALVAVLGFCLQLKFPNMSPSATAYGTLMMNLFIIETCFYIVSLVMLGLQAASKNADMEDLMTMNKICLLLGSLSLILELLVLISPFGWIVLFFWCVCLLWFVSTSYKSLQKLYRSAVTHLVRDFEELKHNLVHLKRRLMDSNAVAALARASQRLKDLTIRDDGRVSGVLDLEAQKHSNTNEVPVSIV